MNAAVYLGSYIGFALALGLSAWSSPRAMNLPALGRLSLGLAATPLLLPVGTLVLSLVWPQAPRLMLIGWPALLTLVWLGWRFDAVLRLLRAVVRRLRRLRFHAPSAWIALGAVALLASAASSLVDNARAPLTAHDALIYFNEARVFANTPAWSTYLDMVNPAEPTALVSGHTHTWLYPTLIAQALLATSAGTPGPDADAVARFVAQANLLWLIIAVGGLAWTLTRRSIFLTTLALAGVLCIRHVAYITSAVSIDAFRILPLVLAASVLAGGPRGRSGWIIAAAFLSLAAAAHTLNLVFAPLLVVARLLAGLSRSGWRRFWQVFVPWSVLFTLPIAAHYWNLWHATGRVFGHGMHYYFYADSPLQAAANPAVLRSRAPDVAEILRCLAEHHGGWIVLAPMSAAVVGLFRLRRRSAGVFVCVAVLLFWAVLASGALFAATRGLTWMMLENFRYPLVLWLFGPPLIAACVAAFGPRFMAAPRNLQWLAAVLVLFLAWATTRYLHRNWPLSYSANDYLAVGERWLADEAARRLAPGENWLTDRNTVAYFSSRAPIFLYTPAGCRWITARDADAAWKLLCEHRVRLVAFNNCAPDWWPRTALHAALSQPGRAERRELPRWQVFLVNLPPAKQ